MPSRTIYGASGNLWFNYDREETAAFLDRLEAAGLSVARVPVMSGTARGRGGGARLRGKLAALQARGLHAYVRTHLRHRDVVQEPVASFYQSGYKVRLLAADYPGVVIGTGAFNEPNLLYRNAVRNGRDVSQMIPIYLERASAYARGWRAAEQERRLDPIPVLTPSMAFPFASESAPWWEAMRPLLEDGTFDGIDIHLHTAYTEYQPRPRRSYSARVQRLYAEHGLTGTMTFVGEAGCRGGSGDRMRVSAEVHGACYAAHLSDLVTIPEVRLVNVWTIGTGGGIWQVDRNGPTGRAVAEWAAAYTTP